MRGKTPKEIRDRRLQKPPKKTTALQQKTKWDWKFWFGIGIGAISLILGAISLRARPTVSLEAPLDPNDVTTTRVVISNDGPLALNNVEVQAFNEKLIYAHRSAETMELGDNFVPANPTIDIGDHKTVPLGRFVYADDKIAYADMGLIVLFTTPYVPFIQRKRGFRFETVRQADGALRFEMQPIDNMLEDYERVRRIFGD